MDNPKFMNVYKLMAKDSENKMCFDCKKPFPKYASINNGIFICEQCADVHKTLGLNISYIRDIHEIWDEYLFIHMQRGGNRRLKRFFETFKIDVYSEIGYKYRTNASEYYRMLVYNIKISLNLKYF